MKNGTETAENEHISALGEKILSMGTDEIDAIVKASPCMQRKRDEAIKVLKSVKNWELLTR